MQQSTKSAYHEHAVHNLVTLQKKFEDQALFKPMKKKLLFAHINYNFQI